MMTTTRTAFFWPMLLFVLLVSRPVAAAGDAPLVAGYPADQVYRLGEAMYRKGVLPSGRPMKAIVQGDIEVSGTMTTCANCHQRSGMGSLEGGIVTPPTNGVKLYAPLKGQGDIPGTVMKRSMFTSPPRPAYDDDSLVKVLQSGIDPAGRRLLDTMPRYELDGDSATILVHYLKNLSSQFSPGMNDEEIRFGVILAEEMSKDDRDALLLPLQAYLREEWNEQLTANGSAWNSRWFSFGRQPLTRTYRRAVLDIWELKGARSTWESQLDEYYRTQPVFAFLGGWVSGSWAPIHDFCEKNGIPCILPQTDLPVVSADNSYTIYFSKGLYQEGEAAAKYLSRMIDLPRDRQVVQLYRATDEGKALAQGFAETWRRLGSSPLVSRQLAAGEKIDEQFWQKLATDHANAVILLWLPPTDLNGIGALARGGKLPPTLFLSSTLLGNALGSVPDAVRDVTFITYPTRLPGDGDYPRSIVTGWLRMKKIPITNLAISAKVYLTTRLLSFALLDMGVEFYRDFFLDLMDDGADQTNSSLAYPLLSFGPGQRYASKGCYIVTLTRGSNPKVVRRSDWVTY